ncbi:MAG: aminopeptidase [Thermoplasmata archaeon]|nr:aminopeptidase [Thermoplasmata archaeon]
MEASTAAKNALRNVLEAVTGERIVLVCDDPLRDVGAAFAQGAVDLGLWTRLVMLETDSIPRKEIPGHLYEIFTNQHPDIFINLLRGSTEETPFRIKVTKMETRRRVRLGHCPGITLDMLTSGALALTDDEYKKMQELAQHLLLRLQNVVGVHVTNPEGTDLTLSVRNRPFFTDTKIDWQTMKWMNLPVGEVLCGPEEDSLEGTLVCETAVGGIGLLEAPVVIKARKGKAVEVTSDDKKSLERIIRALDTDKWSRYVGEFAFGINPHARVVAEFLETEKCNNTSHIAFGNNEDFPNGKNPAANHMDFLITRPTITLTYADGEEYTIMEDGQYKL